MQAGPFLSQKGIDDGITPHDWTTLAIIGILAILAVVVSALASGARVATTGRVASPRHVRAARSHVRAPATPLARLLHRGEGGRDHDPHDERHRVAPAAAAGRAPAVRAAGAHDGHRHGGALLLQRRARRCITLLHDRPDPHRALAVVPVGVRQGVQPRPRRHRQRAQRPLREPVGRAGGHRLQPGPPQRAAPPQRHRARTATPTTTPRTSPRPTARAPSSSGCSARPRCCSSAATWCATATSRSASSPRSSST